MTTTPPGWYDDGQGAQRWWDGTRWTELTGSAPDADAGGTDAGAGPSAPSGVFSAANPEPGRPTSRLWILWVVLGSVLLLVVLLAAVLIPLLLAAFSGNDEERAVAAVELYDEAWSDADCDAFAAATTPAFRENFGLVECADFEDAAVAFRESLQNYEIEVTSVVRDANGITVRTDESYDSLVDADFTPVEEPVPTTDRYVYIVVPAGDGAWAIDYADVEE